MSDTTANTNSGEIQLSSAIGGNRGYCFEGLVSLANLSDWDAALQCVLGSANRIIEQFQGEEPISVTVGKTFATQRKSKVIGAPDKLRQFTLGDPSTWNHGGIKGRWTDYHKEGYRALFPLVAITRDIVETISPIAYKRLASIKRSRPHLEFAFSIEQALTHHFQWVSQTSKNDTNSSGGTGFEDAHAFIVYLAVLVGEGDAPRPPPPSFEIGQRVRVHTGKHKDRTAVIQSPNGKGKWKVQFEDGEKEVNRSLNAYYIEPHP